MIGARGVHRKRNDVALGRGYALNRQRLFFYELPYAVPIFGRRISAQDLNAFKEHAGRTIIRTNLETFAKSRLSQIPFLGEVGLAGLVVTFAQARQFF